VVWPADWKEGVVPQTARCPLLRPYLVHLLVVVVAGVVGAHQRTVMMMRMGGQDCRRRRRRPATRRAHRRGMSGASGMRSGKKGVCRFGWVWVWQCAVGVVGGLLVMVTSIVCCAGDGAVQAA
jgi:hypothetical protein